MWKIFWEKKDTEGQNLALVIFWILVKMCHWHWHWKICGKENKSSMTKTEICWRENKSLMTKAKICLLRHWQRTSAPLAFLLTPLASAAVVNVKFYCKHNFPKSKYLQYFSFCEKQKNDLCYEISPSWPAIPSTKWIIYINPSNCRYLSSRATLSQNCRLLEICSNITKIRSVYPIYQGRGAYMPRQGTSPQYQIRYLDLVVWYLTAQPIPYK